MELNQIERNLFTLTVSSDSLSSILTNGGIKIGKTLSVNGCALIKGTTDFKGAVNIKSLLKTTGISNTSDITSTGNLNVSGNVKFAKTDGKFDLHSPTRFLNTSSESVRIYGGIVVDKSLQAYSTSTENLTSTFSNLGDIQCTSIKINTSSKSNVTGINHLEANSCKITDSIYSNTLQTDTIQAKSCNLEGDLKVSNVNSKSLTCADINSSGVMNLKGDLKAGGYMSIGTLSSKPTVQKHCIIGNVKIQGAVNIDLDSKIFGSLDVSDNVNITGSTSITKSLAVNHNLTVKGNGVVGGYFCIDNQLDSSAYDKGALVVKGGVGIGKNLFVARDITIGKQLYVYSNFSVFGRGIFSSTVDSTAPSTGCMVISGGVGIMKSVNIGNNLQVDGSIQASDLHSNSITIAGTDDSVSFNSGALVVKGGISISKSLLCGSDALFIKKVKTMGQLHVSSQLDSTNHQTGALVVDGGMGISKNVYIEQDLTVKRNLSTDKLTTKNDIKCNNIAIKDINGLCTISGIVSGLRLVANPKDKQRYFTSFDLFSLGSTYTDPNVEALQIFNDSNGHFHVSTRSSGSGKTGDLTLQSGFTGANLTLHSTGSIELSGSGIILSNTSKTLEIELQVPNDESSDQSERYTLILPKTAPPKGVRSTLVCDENGQLIWQRF